MLSLEQLCQELGFGVRDSAAALVAAACFRVLVASPLCEVLWQVILISDTALHLKHFVGLVHEL